MIATLKARNAHFQRGHKSGVDIRKGVPRKRTLFPGQHIICGVCGRPYYWGGHGQMQHMVCSGARDYLCWNSATFDGDLAAKRLSAAVLDGLEKLPEFNESLVKTLHQQFVEQRQSADRRRSELSRQSADSERQIENVTTAIAQSGGSSSLLDRIRDLEVRKVAIQDQLQEIDSQPEVVPEMPSIEEVRALARDSIERLAITDPEFGRLMHRIVPLIVARPFRLLDGGGEFIRAKMDIDLTQLLPRAHQLLIGGVLQFEVTVDIFDPPQRAAYRQEVVDLRASGMTERAVARKLGITITAAQKAMNLHRLMTAQALTDPLVLKNEPRAGRCRPKRHLHPRIAFKPLEGYPRW